MFTDHFVIQSVVRMKDYGLVSVNVKFDTGPRIYEFFIPFDDYVFDKELIGQHIQDQIGS